MLQDRREGRFGVTIAPQLLPGEDNARSRNVSTARTPIGRAIAALQKDTAGRGPAAMWLQRGARAGRSRGGSRIVAVGRGACSKARGSIWPGQRRSAGAACFGRRVTIDRQCRFGPDAIATQRSNSRDDGSF